MTSNRWLVTPDEELMIFVFVRGISYSRSKSTEKLPPTGNKKKGGLEILVVLSFSYYCVCFVVFPLVFEYLDFLSPLFLLLWGGGV